MTRLRYRRGAGRTVATAASVITTRLDLDGANDSYWDTPDASHFNYASTDDLHIEIKLNAEWSGPTGHNYICGQTSAWVLQLYNTGVLRFIGIGGGGLTSFSSAISETDFTDLWIKVLVQVDIGGGNNRIAYYKSTDERETYDLISTSDQAGTAGIPNSSGEFQIGAYAGLLEMTGKIYDLEHRIGIDGAINFQADFNIPDAGDTSFVDPVSSATITQNSSGAVIEEY